MRYLPDLRLIALVFVLHFATPLNAQHSIAREWSEVLVLSMEEDLAQPHVQARTLFHFSIALYDAWAAYDKEADTYLLGKTIGRFTCKYSGIPAPDDVEAARAEAISFAAFRLLTARFAQSPQSAGAAYRGREIMQKHGYDFRNNSIDYPSGSPAALGNYIAQCVLLMAQQDGANEAGHYETPYFVPANPPLAVTEPGTGFLHNPNRWQPLQLKRAIGLDGYPMYECRCGGKAASYMIDSLDPNGRRITNTQTFQGIAWGKVKPFALGTRGGLIVYSRNKRDYWLYHDPGSDFFPRLDTSASRDYQWNFALVAAWSALLDPADGVMWDVSPKSMGQIRAYPANLAELPAFYDLETGRDPGVGYDLNPRTGQAYTPQIVPRGDFIRTAVQYWAEGPDAETPPGHWLSLLNYVDDQPGLVKKFNGKGSPMNALEWDVKAYFVLGAALHDAAIATWGLKSWYESARPVTALRYLSQLGQCTDPRLPSYHPAGIPLLPDRVELVKKGDPLAGSSNEHVGKIKIRAWAGPFSLADAPTPVETAKRGWVLAENWLPYQPKTYVSPPYGGFVSAHATFSHAAAEVLTLLTGDEYFPGGLGEYKVYANNGFLRLEQGPTVDITLQWATYRDAADQASLSRVWAGLNAPFDDIPGRLIGDEVGVGAFNLAKTYFYKDRDGDGLLSFEDCDDRDPKPCPR
ncbi:MAG: vanadium-dependent haloperoxidase [Saprospiraceae bacterium]|nr:vanadium-dependent haloperoxidase [Saprospiraceae bacterium]